VRSRLLSWYRRERRPLPWRGTKNPYAVFVSEIMLQQTTVRAVLPYYGRFMRRFPGWKELASAREDEVLALWSGLGYYARARNLRLAARRIVAENDGQFPRDLSAAMSLPGVGEYTAGAVLSIAYGLPHPAVDGNARRVLARILALRGDVSRSAAIACISGFARSLLDAPSLGRREESPRPSGKLRRRHPVHPGELNQALMELGALVCLPAAPRCEICPLRRLCLARRAGMAGPWPAARRRPPLLISSVSALLRRHGRFLFVREAAARDVDATARVGRTEPRSGTAVLWHLPGTLHEDLAVSLSRARGSPLRHPRQGAVSRDATRKTQQALRGRLTRHLARHCGLRVTLGPVVLTVRHAITHRRVLETVFEGRLAAPAKGNPRLQFRWVSARRAASLPVSGLTKKVLRALRDGAKESLARTGAVHVDATHGPR
jgi:A/G-specific adenine glycosylase